MDVLRIIRVMKAANRTHVIYTGRGDGAVVDIVGNIPAKVCVPRVEGDVPCTKLRNLTVKSYLGIALPGIVIWRDGTASDDVTCKIHLTHIQTGHNGDGRHRATRKKFKFRSNGSQFHRLHAHACQSDITTTGNEHSIRSPQGWGAYILGTHTRV